MQLEQSQGSFMQPQAAPSSQGSQVDQGSSSGQGNQGNSTGLAGQSSQGGLSLEENEHQAILRALERTAWVKKTAADLLGISRRAIHYKIKKYNIQIPGKDQDEE